MKLVCALPVLTLTLSTQVWAVVCKTVEADGSVRYTDVPVEQCRNPVKLPDYSRYAPRPIEPSAPNKDDARDSDAPVFKGYRTAEIQQPEQDGTVRSNEGVVPVTVRLDPPLQPGHEVRFFLDGQSVPGSFDSQAVELSGVLRGTHRVRAVVVDSNGARLTSTTDVTFTLRQTGLFDSAVRPPPTVPLPAPR